jgi:DNA-binding transcriptional regulator YiaG
VDLMAAAEAEVAREMCATGDFHALRLARFRTLWEVAGRVGVSAATVSRWERGLHLPAGDKALALLQVAREMAEGGR